MKEIKEQIHEVSKQSIRLVDLLDVQLPHLSFHINNVRKTLNWLDGYIEGLIWKDKPPQDEEDEK